MTSIVNNAIPALMALVLLEYAVARHRGQRVHRLGDTAVSLCFGIGEVLINLLVGSIRLAIYAAAYELAPLKMPEVWWVWVLVFFAEDLTYYWNHRILHECRFFWASHIVHHSSVEMNLATALRQTWFGIFTNFIFWIPLLILGFSPTQVLTVKAINLLYQFWVHTRFVGKLGPFELIFNTPSHHRVHHARNIKYLDKNYAGTLIIWDRLFGTFMEEVDEPEYGLRQNMVSLNPIHIVTREWVELVRDAWRAQDLRQALAFAFAAPGWSPDGSTKTTRQLQADLGDINGNGSDQRPELVQLPRELDYADAGRGQES